MTPRVALVGPFPPWRSGIADQDQRLLNAMRRLGVAPVVVGFSRMYPKFLYPGTTEYLEEEKKNFLEGEEGKAAEDAASSSQSGGGSVRLDGLNPYSFVRAARFLSFEEISLLVLPWWTSYFAPHVSLFLSTLGAERPSTVRLLLCHNVFDHEARPWRDALTRLVLRRADRFADSHAQPRSQQGGIVHGQRPAGRQAGPHGHPEGQQDGVQETLALLLHFHRQQFEPVFPDGQQPPRKMF